MKAPPLNETLKVFLAKDTTLINKRLFLATLVQAFEGIEGVCALIKDEFDETEPGTPARRDVLSKMMGAILSHGTDGEEPEENPEQIALELRRALWDELKTPEGLAMIGEILREADLSEETIRDLRAHGIGNGQSESE